MKVTDLLGKRFKWISPITGGETFGEVQKVYNYRFENSPLIETKEGNVYPIKECFIKIGDEFEKIELDE